MKESMRNMALALAAVALVIGLAWLVTPTAKAADVLRVTMGARAFSGVELAASGTTNVAAVLQCTGGKELYLAASWSGSTNLAFVIQYSADGIVWTTNAALQKTWTWSDAAASPNTGNAVYTNYTINGCPYVRLYSVANTGTLGATNLSVTYFNK